MENTTFTNKENFNKYETFIIAILTTVQFTVVLDFMVISPLGDQLLEELSVSTKQFGWVVSSYAFSAFVSGVLAAGFADKFDRKKLLLFFYTGFIIGTLFCGIAPDYYYLLIARIVTGLFGGVMSSISLAIITDLFHMNLRGRVMGFVQMAFASSQVLGIPLGLYLANNFGWHSPFLLIVGVSIPVVLVIVTYMKPIDAHLKRQRQTNALRHFGNTVTNGNYLKGFAAIALLATGGFMLMPFGSAFSVNNLGISREDLPFIYMVTGISSIICGPLAGKMSDKFGKYKVFLFGSIITIIIVGIYCNLGITPLWLVIAINVVMFVGVTSRMISASALMTAVPEQADRGAFMSIQSSVQQLSGGFASALAGLIVFQTTSGKLENYDILGYVVMFAVIVTMVMMAVIDRQVSQKKEPK